MIRLTDVEVGFRDFSLGPLDLHVPDGSFYMLMGPTGSGKTLLLETVAGLVKLDRGTVEVAGSDVTNNPPGRRKVGIVYQDSALFPHLTVRQNITYGVRYSDADRGTDFDKLVGILDLERLLERLPGKLSGGERQRTALARALITDPRVVLLDEPLSSLDQMFRSGIRSELKSIREETATTFLMTTHDFADALSLGTMGAVIRNGSVEQEGTIDDIFNSPETPFMASFIGMKNVYPAEFQGETAHVEELLVRHASQNMTGHGFIAVSPDSVVISRTSSVTSERNRFPGRIASIEQTGTSFGISVDCRGTIIVSHVTRSAIAELGLTVGAEVFVSFKASCVHVF